MYDNFYDVDISIYKDFLSFISFRKYKGGIFNSENLLILNTIKNNPVDIVIDGGTGKLSTTRALLKFLDKRIKIKSIDTNSKLIRKCNKIIDNENIEFINNNILNIIDDFSKNNDKKYSIILDFEETIDNIYIAFKILYSDFNCKYIFVHDLGKNKIERKIIERISGNIYFSDDSDFLKKYGNLDLENFQYFKYNRPLIFEELQKFGRPTLGVIFNKNINYDMLEKFFISYKNIKLGKK